MKARERAKKEHAHTHTPSVILPMPLGVLMKRQSGWMDQSRAVAPRGQNEREKETRWDRKFVSNYWSICVGEGKNELKFVSSTTAQQ